MISSALPIYPRPSLGLLATEGVRGLADFGSYVWARKEISAHLVRGDGHPVLVLPGFLVGNGSTILLRRLLRKCGYCVSGWPLGRNLGLRAGVEEAMTARLQDLAAGGRQISIIGQSLGGVFARELAKRHPKKVRSVITLGSPFGEHPQSTNAARVYQWMTGQSAEAVAEAFRDIPNPPPVPSTAIFSRFDGVVAWQGACERDCSTCENIEVTSSHVGMGVHPGVLIAAMDRLAQSEGTWRPFEPEPWSARFFPGRRALLTSNRALPR